MDYRDALMDERRLYTAWDSRKDEERLFHGLRLLVEHGVRPRHLMVYMLIGYWPGETRKLREFGALPYPMPFERTSELLGMASYSWDEMCSLQGLPASFDLPGFTRTAKREAVGNGVPLVMGRAVARAVKRAVGAGTAPGDALGTEGA